MKEPKYKVNEWVYLLGDDRPMKSKCHILRVNIVGRSCGWTVFYELRVVDGVGMGVMTANEDEIAGRVPAKTSD